MTANLRIGNLRAVGASLALLAVLPAVVFLVAVVGRLQQPIANEPAHTFDAIVSWFGTLGPAGLTLLLLVLPTAGMAVGAFVAWRTLREDPDLRSDLLVLGATFLRIGRRPVFVVPALAVLAGLGIVAAVVTHAIAD